MYLLGNFLGRISFFLNFSSQNILNQDLPDNPEIV